MEQMLYIVQLFRALKHRRATDEAESMLLVELMCLALMKYDFKM